MRLRRELLEYAAVFAGALGMVIMILQQVGTKDDPVFEGRRLSSWLADGLSSDREVAAASSNAIVRLGTNGFPFLIGELSAEDSKARTWIGSKGVYGSWFVPASLRQMRACHAVRILGKEAQPLERYVTNLLGASISGVRLGAFQAVGAMRLTNVVRALTNAVVADPSIGIRVVAARHLVSIDFDQAEVLDLLVTNSWTRGQTKPALRGFALSIQSMGISPELLENKIRDYAKSPFPQVRTFVAVGLPIWLPNSGLTRRILAELAGDTNQTVATAAAMEVRK